MKIKKIHIDGFGRLHDTDIVPGDGITIFCGRNEAGKSTLHLFIRSLLYGASTKRRLGMKSVYERMRPWQRPEIYRGRAEIEFEQQRYMIERDFNKAPDDLTVMELGEGVSRRSDNPEELLKRILNGLTETAYVNTVSTGQLGAATQKDMANELRRYSSNISSTMNPKLNADKANKYLEAERARLNAELDTEAPKEYNRVLTELKRIESELKLPENENRISALTAEADKLSQSSTEISKKADAAENELTSYGETLRSKGFANESEINGISRTVHEQYDALKTLKRRAGSRISLAAAVLFGAAAIAAAVFGYMYAAAELRLPAYIAAGVCAAAAAAVSARITALKKRLKHDTEVLSKGLEPYIGVKELSEDSIREFDEYISSAGLISGKMNELRAQCEVLTNEQKKLNEEYADYLDSLSEQQKRKAGVEELLARATKLQDRAVQLQRVIRNNKLVREKLEAVQLAEETLNELASDIRGAAGTYINKAASEMVAAITDNAYDSISAGQSYDIELNSKQGMIAVSDMSAGTADQVYLAIRLATVRFITGEADPLPLILDDSFNLYDDDRLKAALRFLAQNYAGQVFIFTCQNREENVLDELGVNYKRIVMDSCDNLNKRGE